MRKFVCLFFLLLLVSFPFESYAANGSAKEKILTDLEGMGIKDATVDANLMINIPLISECPGHTGVSLAATLIRPGGAVKPRPTILIGTVYRCEYTAADGYGLLKHGYNVLSVDVRGSGSSSGKWLSFDLPEQYDFAYIIDKWIPSQSWSDGKVGMSGASYCAIIQLLASGLCEVDEKTGEPVHLKALFPYVPMSDPYRTIAMHGGNFEEEFMLLWLGGASMLGMFPPVIEQDESMTDAGMLKLKLDIWNTHFRHFFTCMSWLRDPGHDSYCDFYKVKSAMLYWPDKPKGGWRYDDGTVINEGKRTLPAKLPVFVLGGWFDIFVLSTLETYSYGLKNHSSGDKALIVGPWYHWSSYKALGINGLSGASGEIQARWFDWKIKGVQDPFMLDYPVLLYVMGEEKFRAEKSWPIPESRTEPGRLYLSSLKASHIKGDWYTNPLSLRNNNKNNFLLSWNNSVLNYGGDAPVLKHSPLDIHGMNSRSMTRWMGGSPSMAVESKHIIEGEDNSGLGTEDERDDERGVLTFTTEPLEKDIEITGPVLLKFWAKTKFDKTGTRDIVEGSVKLIRELFDIDEGLIVENLCKDDVQWVAEINDVFEDGRARNITSGWLAAWLRPYNPGKPTEIDPEYVPFDPLYIANMKHPDRNEIKEDVTYCYALELWPTCNVFKKDHRIRLSISGSDFPHMLPILIPSTNTIVLDADHPAALEFNIANKNDEGVTWKWIRQGPDNSGFNKYPTLIQNEFDAANSYLTGPPKEQENINPEENSSTAPESDSSSGDSDSLCFISTAFTALH
jgi:uncharacterized protein